MDRIRWRQYIISVTFYIITYMLTGIREMEVAPKKYMNVEERRYN